MEKEERTAMLVSKYILLVCFFSLPFISLSQVNLIPKNEKAKKSYSFMLASGVSKSKEPSGSGIYIVPPYYVNLKIREPYLFAYRVEISQGRINRKGWTISKGLGFSSYSYILYYDYDKEASIGTDLSDRMDFNFVYATLNIGKPFLINKFSIEPYLGISANYLVKAKLSHRDEFGSGKSSQINKYKPWAFGWELGSKLTYQYNDNIGFELRPSFNKIQKEYGDVTGSSERMVYSYTLGFALIKKIKSKS